MSENTSSPFNSQLLAASQAASGVRSPAITGVQDNSGSVQGVVQKGATTDDSSLSVRGTADAGALVTVYANGQAVGSASADSSGNWSLQTSALGSDASYALSAKASVAGVQSAASGEYRVVLDTTAPQTPAVPEALISSNAGNGALVQAGQTIDDRHPTLRGSGQPGELVIISDTVNGQTSVLGSTTVDANGQWRFSPATPLDAAAHQISVSLTDAAGNQSAASAALDFTISGRSLSVEILKAQDNQGSTPIDVRDGGVTDDSTPLLVGRAAAMRLVTVRDSNTNAVLGSATTNSEGIWTLQLGNLGTGEHTFVASIPTAGEPMTDTLRLRVVAPVSAPQGEIRDDVGSEQGALPSSRLSDDSTPSVEGTGRVPGELIRLYVDNGTTPVGSAVVRADGSWSVTPEQPLALGQHRLAVSATGEVGKESARTELGTLIVSTRDSYTPTVGDMDGDGVLDINDIDVDGDGILNVVESPEVFSAQSTREISTAAQWDALNLRVTGVAVGSAGTYTQGLEFNYAGIDTAASSPVNIALATASEYKRVSLDVLVRKEWAASVYGNGVQALFELVDAKGSVVASTTWVPKLIDSSQSNNNETVTISGEGQGLSLRITDKSTAVSTWGDDWAVQTLTIRESLRDGSNDVDGDSVVNAHDLDSDNDGIADNIEAQTTAGYKAPWYADSDGDGLDDAYDANIGDKTAAASQGLSPVDTDGDQTADIHDSNSDNDSFSDRAESGWPYRDISQNYGTATGGTDASALANNGNTAENDYRRAPLTAAGADLDGDGVLNADDLDIDGDGILNSVEGGLSEDSDNDGLLNQYDLDSDNDGLADNVEAQTTAGYQAPLGVDADKDGLDDRYDANTSNTSAAASAGLTPVNTDGVDQADFRDSDSDNDGFSDRAEAGVPYRDISQSYRDVRADGQPGSLADNFGTSERDYRELLPLGADQDLDGDGVRNQDDLDIDGDGIVNDKEVHTRLGGMSERVIDTAAEWDALGVTGTAVNVGSNGQYTRGLEFNYSGTDTNTPATIPLATDSEYKKLSVDVVARKEWSAWDYGGNVQALFELVDAQGTVVASINWTPALVAGDLSQNNETVSLSGEGRGLRLRITDKSPADYFWGDDWAVENMTIREQLRETVSDSDGDGIADIHDLDSDNDGIADNIEAQSTTGYRAPVGYDEDRDGLDDAYDANVGDKTAAASQGLTPVDTDGDRRTDVVDLDSDNDGRSDRRESGLAEQDISQSYREPTGGIGPADLSNTGGGAERDYREAIPLRTTAEDTPYVFTLADAALVAQSAGFNPVFLTSLKVINMPADGVLQKQLANQTWVSVALNDNIPLQDIRDGKLRFMPDTNESGFDGYQTTGIGNQKSLYAEFTFQALGMGAGPLSGTSAFGMKVTPQVDMDFVPDVAPSTVQAFANGAHRYSMRSIITDVKDAEGIDGDGSERMGRLTVTYQAGMQFFKANGTVINASPVNGEVALDLTDYVQLPSTYSSTNGWGWFYSSQIQAHVYREEIDSQGNVLAVDKATKLFQNSHFVAPAPRIDPLVLDLNGDGVQTSGLDNGVSFDLNGDGTAGMTSWTAGGDGLLVLDRNGDGRISTGAELFGDVTRLNNGELANNGFSALIEMDSNRDARISAADEHFGDLRVWVDANHDGVSQAAELHTLLDVGVASIDLAAVQSERVVNGDHFGLLSSYTRTDGTRAEVADVWFQTTEELARQAANTVI